MSTFGRKRGEKEPAPGTPEIYSVTGASTPHSEDQDARISRYLVSMGIRTVCVILALVVPGPLRWVFVAGAVFLPYVAVIMANSGRRRDGAGPEGVTPGATRALPGTRTPLPSQADVPRGPGPDGQWPDRPRR